MILRSESPLGSVDFGRTEADYGRFRAGFPDAFFSRLKARGWVSPGARLLDIGSGTGTLARGMAQLGCRSFALDIAPQLLKTARILDDIAAIRTRYLVAAAENLPIESGSFDLVTAGQCWHWFDGIRAAKEVNRALAPGGYAIIAHFDWLPLPGNVVEATEALIEVHNPRWHLGGGNGFYPRWLDHLRAAGFVDLEAFAFDLDIPYSQEAWRGRIRASAGIGASLEDDRIEAFDRDLQALLRRSFPDDPLAVPHRVFATIGRKPGNQTYPRQT